MMFNDTVRVIEVINATVNVKTRIASTIMIIKRKLYAKLLHRQSGRCDFFFVSLLTKLYNFIKFSFSICSDLSEMYHW